MRKQLNEIKEIIGRTAKGAVRAGSICAISFKDDSFIIIDGDYDFDDGVTLYIDMHPPTPDANLVRAGIFTRDELVEENKQHDAWCEQREREQYERLRAKYEEST